MKSNDVFLKLILVALMYAVALAAGGAESELNTYLQLGLLGRVFDASKTSSGQPGTGGATQAVTKKGMPGVLEVEDLETGEILYKRSE